MAGIYISWPFCAQKCTYCNFASGVYAAPERQRYSEALQTEIVRHRWTWKPETVYLGGGTPSLMSEAELEAVLGGLPGAPWVECTMEAAPGSLTREGVSMWRRLGVNRVSLGVQSFVDRELRQTGRRHTAEVVAEECALLRQEGITNINIDLIAGLPHQTPETWKQSLEWVLRIQPPHVSVYMLEVDEDSRLGLEILGDGGRYGAGAVPSDEVITANYLQAVEVLRASAIPRYEISNFACRGAESRHNLKYWCREPYIGFGVDAHSCDAGRRWGNADTLPAYLDAVAAGTSPAIDTAPERPTEERFLLGLRLDAGVDYPPSAWAGNTALARRIAQRVREGLLIQDGQRLRLSERGILLSNEVFADFLDADAPNYPM